MGNGLAQRCAMWVEVLEGIGSVTRVVVPVAGPADGTAGEVVVEPTGIRSPLVPLLARGITHDLGLIVACQIVRDSGPIDLVLGMRSYTGLLCQGMQAATGARLVIDLDDDDAAFFRAEGDRDEARRFERLISRLADSADVMVSAQGFGDTVAVPNSVHVPSSVDQVGRYRAVGDRPTVLFVGNCHYPPNRVAARWLIDEIAPLVLDRRPDALVTIAGHGSEDLSPFGCGFVADLGALMRAADVFVAPILSGSGTRIKILDAWAHGVPTVSTSVGADGLQAVDGTHLLLADDAASFAEAVLQLLDHPVEAASLAAAGRSLALDHHSRGAVVAAAQTLGEGVRQGPVVASLLPSLDTTETDDGLVVLDTVGGRVHELDQSASVVLSLIDGGATDAEIAAEVQMIYGLAEAPLDVVAATIDGFITCGLAVRVRLDQV
jgi:hypothetical protein